MSLGELNSAIADVANEAQAVSSVGDDHGDENNSEDEVADDVNSKNSAHEAVETNSGHRMQGVSPESEAKEDLPQLPIQPGHDICKSLWNGVDLNLKSDDVSSSRCLDPSALMDYGKLPSGNVFLALLRLIVGKVEERRSRNHIVKDNQSRSSCKGDGKDKDSK